MSHLFLPAWLLHHGRGWWHFRAFSRCAKMRVDLLMSFKVTWDHFASLGITWSSKRCPREGCLGCPGCTSRPSAPQLSLHPFALPSAARSSLIMMFFSFGLWGFLSSVKDERAARFSPSYGGVELALSELLCRVVGCRCAGLPPPSGISLEVSSGAETLAMRKGKGRFPLSLMGIKP